MVEGEDLYLEVPYKELLARNHIRKRHIPENVLETMIQKLEIPAPWYVQCGKKCEKCERGVRMVEGEEDTPFTWKNGE